MPPISPRQGLQTHVTAAILDAAARVLADRGPAASMNDVAMEAGVARATVYRYFPNRQALLDALVGLAVRDAGARLLAARIDELPVEQAVPRAVRALFDVGDAFMVVVREHARGDVETFDQSVAAPLRALFTRAQQAGELRDDSTVDWLGEFLIGIVVGALGTVRHLGHDDLVALATSFFLDGARQRRPTLEVVA